MAFQAKSFIARPEAATDLLQSPATAMKIKIIKKPGDGKKILIARSLSGLVLTSAQQQGDVFKWAGKLLRAAYQNSKRNRPLTE
ncbi:hypothetical protein C4J81_03565 [Deltaproteobacteria bacterium Smac51]|nr:hypothetical protein C4J81_03565 [Deltaproteobacteria bacterium Smac51]